MLVDIGGEARTCANTLRRDQNSAAIDSFLMQLARGSMLDDNAICYRCSRPCMQILCIDHVCLSIDECSCVGFGKAVKDILAMVSATDFVNHIAVVDSRHGISIYELLRQVRIGCNDLKALVNLLTFESGV